MSTLPKPVRQETSQPSHFDSQRSISPRTAEAWLVAKRTPVTQQVVAMLQQRILSGELKGGSRLDSQRELSERLGVSRASLREAISTLEAFGLVSVEPGRGVFVIPEDLRAAAVASDESVEPSREELYEARFLMEGWAAALAALSISDEQLGRLKTLVDGMQDALDKQNPDALDRLDYEFHSCIASVTLNSVLRKMLAPIFTEHDMSDTRIRDTAFISTRVKEHRDIFAAIASRDPNKAQKAMRQHVLRSAKRARVDLTAIAGIEKLLP